MGNPTYNVIFGKTHLVLGKLVCTYNLQENYVGKDEPSIVILVAAYFWCVLQYMHLRVILLYNFYFSKTCLSQKIYSGLEINQSEETGKT